jgi:hypothetical protein
VRLTPSEDLDPTDANDVVIQQIDGFDVSVPHVPSPLEMRSEHHADRRDTGQPTDLRRSTEWLVSS